MTIDTNRSAALPVDPDNGERVGHGVNWLPIEVSGGRVHLIEHRPGAQTLHTTVAARPSSADQIDGLLRARGQRLVAWDPHAREAVAASLPSTTERVRDVIAHALGSGVDPWDVEVTLTEDDDGGRTVTVLRAPSVPAERRRDRWLSIAHDFFPHDDDSLWRYSEQWVGVQHGRNAVVLTYSRDPLAEVSDYPWDVQPTMEAIPFGVAESGAVITYPVLENSWLLGGLPGGGKSGGQTAIMCGASRLDHTAIIGIDAKRVELRPWASRMSALGVEMSDIDAILAAVVAEMQRRYRVMEGRGIKKFIPCADTPLIVVSIDELAEIVGQGGDKETKQAEESRSALIRRLMSLGRAAGIVVLLATQKPSSDIVPTALRDMVISRVAFSCATDAQVDTILGAGSCHAGARADRIPRARRGVCYAQTEDSRDAIRMRTFWVPDDQVEQVARDTARLRVPLPWLDEALADGDADIERTEAEAEEFFDA